MFNAKLQDNFNRLFDRVCELEEDVEYLTARVKKLESGVYIEPNEVFTNYDEIAKVREIDKEPIKNVIFALLNSANLTLNYDIGKKPGYVVTQKPVEQTDPPPQAQETTKES